MVTQRKKQERAAARERRRASRASPEDAFEPSGWHARPGGSNPAVSAALDSTDRIRVTTAAALKAALDAGSPGDVIDLCLKTITLPGVTLAVTRPGVAVENGTLECASFVVEAAAASFSCRNVAFKHAAPTGLPYLTEHGPLVSVRGAQGVVFDTCAFRDSSGPLDADADTLGPCAGLAVDSGADVSVTGCEFRDNAGTGLHVAGHGTAVVARRVLASGNGVDGVHVCREATLRIEEGTFDANERSGLFAHGATIAGSDVVCRNSQGPGACAAESGTLILNDCQVLDNDAAGVTVQDRGSTAAIDGIVCRAPNGFGVAAGDGGACTVRRGRVHGADMALAVNGSGSALTASDVSVREADFGASAIAGGALTLERVTMEDIREMGVHAMRPATRVTATDLAIRSCGHRGVSVSAGVRVSLRRCTIEETRKFGVFADDPGTHVEMEDVDVSTCGFCGVMIIDGASVNITGGKSVLSASFGMGVEGNGREHATATVTDMECSQNGEFGLVAKSGGEVTATGCAFRDNGKHGVLSWGEGSRVVLRDSLAIDNGRLGACCMQGGEIVDG